MNRPVLTSDFTSALAASALLAVGLLLTGPSAAWAGADDCASCSAGQYCNRSGASPTCMPCDAGTYNPVDNGICVECPPGTYADAPGSTGCTPCAAGTADGTPGRATACPVCDPGQYSEQGWQTCIECPAGAAAAVDRASCIPCDVGTFSNAGATTCRDCLPGTYAPYTGLAHCEPCPAGWSSGAAAFECVPCLPGSFAEAAESPFCLECPAGTVNDGGLPLCFEISTCLTPFFLDSFESGDTAEWSSTVGLPP